MKVVEVLSKNGVLRLYLNFFAVAYLYIEREWVWKIYYAFITCLSALGCGVLLNSIIIYLNDIDSLAVIMHHIMLLFDVLFGSQVVFHKRKTLRRLIKGISQSFDYESPIVSQFLKDLQEKREKSMKKVFKYIIFTVAFMPINLIIFSFVEKYTRNLNFILLFPCWFPFDLSYLPYHIMAYFWQQLIILSIALIVGAALALAYIVYNHMTTQIVLLKYAIKKLDDRAYEMTLSDLANKAKYDFEKRIRDSYIKGSRQCVQHHLMIIDYYMDAKDFLKIIYFLIFLTGVILLTSTGFALISENTSLKIKFIGVNAVQMTYLFIFSWLVEQISDHGESIRLAIYETEWYKMPKESQSSLKLMVERTLKPFHFFTVTGQKVDLQNFMAMVNASYSYFNMMLATQQK